jgi:hypothetical protein
MIKGLKLRTYILERTRGFFAGRPDKPCSGAARFEPCLGPARFEPADTGAAPLRSAASTAATRSPARACGALGVDAESDDFPRDRHLCRESESGRSEPS